MRIVRKRAVAAALAALAAFSLVFGVAIAAPTPAQAANPSAGFDAANIIDDALFYDGNAMTAAQVQQFLNQQVPSCWLGRPGYEVGKWVTWGGVATQLASKCTKDYAVKTETRAANAYCGAYAGGGVESSAQIIQKVGKACGISQRVLLITLQKEQSLITDPWPNNEQYFRAMGYACPDSGPGGTATCDRAQGGFFQQVYRAAWQLKVYKAFPNDYNYKPFRNNYIQWHPSAACGGSTVYIQNWATAALYIYTPYRPNQAALNAGWGTGDGCSSYGNRNFYNFYTSWFGSPRGVSVDSRLATYYDGLGGLNSEYGRAIENAASAPGGGISQRFSGGLLYWSPAVGFGAVTGAISTLYLQEGGASGYLGYPLGAEVRTSGAVRQEFQNGTAYWTSASGASVINGDIRKLYNSEGGPTGYLGYPIGAEVRSNGGARQEFQRGTAYFSPATGASVINGEIRKLYLAEGGPTAYLGYPIGVEIRENGAARQEFKNGTAYWSPASGAAVINGEIRKLYLAEGGPTGYLGFPVGAEIRADGGARQEFQSGTAYYSNATGASVINGEIRKLYLAEGGHKGYLGYPVGAEIRADGGARQEFKNGTAYYTNATGASMINGEIRKLYLAEGGHKGYLGYPVGAEIRADGGARQEFQNGTAYYSNATGASVINGEIRKLYLAEGGHTGYLGYPVGPEVRANGAARQEFKNGTAYWSPASGTAVINGEIRKTYLALGGPTSKLGFPVGAERRYEGGAEQKFEKGSILWTSKSGTTVEYAEK